MTTEARTVAVNVARTETVLTGAVIVWTTVDVGAASRRHPQTLLAFAGDAPMSSEGVGAGPALF